MKKMGILEIMARVINLRNGMKKTSLFFFLLAGIFSLSYAQDWSQQFQKTADNSGYYRNLGNIGFPGPYNFLTSNIGWYSDRDRYTQHQYPTVIKGGINNVTPVIDVPEPIIKAMSDTLKTKGSNRASCFMEEFIFPYGKNGKKGYLAVMVYGQETWDLLDCASAFFIQTY
jgi:hypothetical protein